MALNRGIPIASGACLGVAFYSMFAARKNVVNGQKIYDEYLKVVGADEVIYLKESYENERSMQKKNQRNAIIFGSVGAALGATSIYIFKKVKSTKPVYVDPGAVEFDSASLNYQSGGLMCSINFRLR